MYRIPDEYFFRLHHVRPRFKGDVENVLIYMAEELCRIGAQPNDVFKQAVNDSIKLFPGNITKKQKTIDNWRTEISSLFGLIIDDGNVSKASLRAEELAQNEDLVEFFKKFLFTFQYPGAHIKNHEIYSILERNIKFKPVQYLITLLNTAEKLTGKRAAITKGEFCHCVFNDLRCTRDHEAFEVTWKRICTNRENNIQYDLSGDIVRYAGDIIDYMEIANLIVTYDGFNYFTNSLESESLMIFENSKEWFSGYDSIDLDIHSIGRIKHHWFQYVNRNLEDSDFATDILSFISHDEQEYRRLVSASYTLLDKRLEDVSTLRTKDIGDIGEGMVFGHEKQRVKNGGRADLLHLIQRIPTQFAVGYDISSVELDERRRYIEVKTTISSKPLHFNKIHLTPNEWRTASTVNGSYFVYRLMISKNETKLFVIQDPVYLYKNDLIDMLPKDGADITFDTNKSGKFEELLTWIG